MKLLSDFPIKVQEEEKKTEKQQSETFESDQSKMIKDLFDGKYIN